MGRNSGAPDRAVRGDRALTYLGGLEVSRVLISTPDILVVVLLRKLVWIRVAEAGLLVLGAMVTGMLVVEYAYCFPGATGQNADLIRRIYGRIPDGYHARHGRTGD